MAKKSETAKKSEPTFAKRQIMASEKFAAYKDVVNVCLDDDKMYSITEAQEICAKFLAAPVNEYKNK